MPYPSVYLPLDRITISQRRSARTQFDQKHRRGPPVSDSDAFDDEVRTALERVLLDGPERNGNEKTKDERSARRLLLLW